MRWIKVRIIEWALQMGLISPVPREEAGPDAGLVEIGWDDTDQYRSLTVLTLVGLPIVWLVWAMGLPILDLHPLHRVGIMAPTCGLTRGVMWASRGEFGRAVQFNPASLLVLPTMAAIVLRAAWGSTRGRWLGVSVRRKTWLRGVAIVAIVALSVRQQSVAAFLLSHPAG